MMKAKIKEDNRKTDLVKQTPGNLKTLTVKPIDTMIKKQRDKSQIYKIRNGKGEMARVSWTKF